MPFPSYYTRSLLSDLFARLLPPLKPQRVDLSGKTAIVLGANTGIGLEIARGLALMGAHVFLVCRSLEKAKSAVSDILDNAKGAVKPEQLESMQIDCADLESVNKFAQAWGSRPLDVLINNAGMTSGTYKKSPQDFEITYAVNMLSHVLLTMSLLPYMREKARVVNVSSVGHAEVKEQLDPDDLDYSAALEGKLRLQTGSPMSPLQGLGLYKRTKLLQVFFTVEMQSRLDHSPVYAKKHITVHSYHPGKNLDLGLVKTEIWNREDNFVSGWSYRAFTLRMVNFFGVSSCQGAATGVFLATAEEPVRHKGRYWERMTLWGHNPLVDDEEMRSRIFDQMCVESKLPESLRI